MNESETPNKSRRGGVIGGVLLIVVALALVVAGRSPGGLSFGFGGSDSDATASSGPGVTEVRGVIGSEKRPFFDDPEVEQRLKELGFNVSVETSGSREIAEKQDLNAYDFAFPSSAPAAEKIKGKVAGSEQFEPFYSPMAIATFTPVVDVLTREGVVRDAGGTTVLDMNAYIDLAQSDKRWRDLGPEVASPRRVQISTTDIRTSNSAAMYLSILSWLFSERAPEMKDNVDQLSGAIIPFFSGQGYTSSSSAGPFADYLSKGIGAAPMVMIYEAQYLGEAMRDTPRLHADGQLVYPRPHRAGGTHGCRVHRGGKEPWSRAGGGRDSPGARRSARFSAKQFPGVRGRDGGAFAYPAVGSGGLNRATVVRQAGRPHHEGWCCLCGQANDNDGRGCT